MKRQWKVGIISSMLMLGLRWNAYAAQESMWQNLKIQILNWYDNVMAGSGDPVVAEVGSYQIRKSYYLACFDQLPPRDKARYLSEKQREEFLNKVIARKLWLAEASKSNLEKANPVRAILSVHHDAILGEEYRSRSGNDELTVSEAEVEDYYRKHPKEFLPRSDVWVSRIVVKTIADARRVQKLLKTVDFVDLARRVSIDPLDKRGRPMKAMAAGRSDPQLEQMLSKMTIGQVSDVKTCPEGYQILRKVGQINWPTSPYDWVRDNIRMKLAQGKETKAVEKIHKSIPTKIHFDVLEAIPFPPVVPAPSTTPAGKN